MAARKQKPKIVSEIRKEIVIPKYERTIIHDPSDSYAHYKSMSKYHRSCLPASNYWAVINGLEIINVPETDKYYYKNFDNRCYEIRNELVERQEKLELLKIKN